MGLFDHLFKPRPEGSVERVVEAPLKASGLVERTTGVEGEVPPDPATAFLQPKGYAPGTTGTVLGGQNQGFVPVLPAAKRAPAPDRKPMPVDDSTAATDMVVLTVGDVLPRIPVPFLRPGPHDLKRELRFHIDDLASDITRGRPAIALSCIAEQCPDLFHKQISDAEDMAIRLPLQKLVEQVGHIRSHAPHATPLVAHPPVRPAVAPLVEKPKPEVPAPAPVSAPLVAEKIVEPVPSPPVTPVPVAPPPPSPAPQIVVPIAQEQARAQESEPPVKLAASIPDEPVAANIPDEPVAASVPDEPVPYPMPHRSAEMAPPGSVIDLSLAAIVAKVPREMIVEPLPHISESERITLPFPMIERQLGTGSVEIPAKLFWSALPPLLKHYFSVRDDLTVSLPLEEIFQNLPVAGGGERRRFEPVVLPSIVSPGLETPIVLAPAPPNDTTPELKLDLPPPLATPVAKETPVAEPPELVVAAVPEPAGPAVEPAPTSEPAPVPAPAVVASATPPPPTSSEHIVLTAAVSGEIATTSAANLAPVDAQPSFVHLQPFRTFNPPSPTVEPEPEEPTAEPVVLGEGAAPSVADAAQMLRPASDAKAASENGTTSPGAVADEDAGEVPPTVSTPLDVEPPETRVPQFSMLPSPALEQEPVRPPAALPPQPEPLVAFNPDQPPPLKIEEPAAAVAVLRATVPAPQELPEVAMATGNLQPPRIFRPVVLPPRISGVVATSPVNLAPTLAGPGSTAGMISLSPAAEPRSPAPFTPAEPPAALAPQAPNPPQPSNPPPAAEPVPAPPSRATDTASVSPSDEPAPTLKSLVRRLFTGPSAQGDATTPVAPPSDAIPKPAEASAVAPPPTAPEPPATPAPAPAQPAKELPPTAAASFQLPLPPLPKSAPVVAPPADQAPPALPISRFDQHSLQSLFMTEETLDLPKISRLGAALPGIQGCVIVARGETFTSGILPEGFHLNALRGLSPQVGAAADRLPIGELKNFTLYGEQYSISFFERPAVCLCAIHRARSFVPGVREKLVAVVDELARGGMRND